MHRRLYPVDKSRVNEFGVKGDHDHEQQQQQPDTVGAESTMPVDKVVPGITGDVDVDKKIR